MPSRLRRASANKTRLPPHHHQPRDSAHTATAAFFPQGTTVLTTCILQASSPSRPQCLPLPAAPPRTRPLLVRRTAPALRILPHPLPQPCPQKTLRETLRAPATMRRPSQTSRLQTPRTTGGKLDGTALPKTGTSTTTRRASRSGRTLASRRPTATTMPRMTGLLKPSFSAFLFLILM